MWNCLVTWVDEVFVCFPIGRRVVHFCGDGDFGWWFFDSFLWVKTMASFKKGFILWSWQQEWSWESSTKHSPGNPLSTANFCRRTSFLEASTCWQLLRHNPFLISSKRVEFHQTTSRMIRKLGEEIGVGGKWPGPFGASLSHFAMSDCNFYHIFATDFESELNWLMLMDFTSQNNEQSSKCLNNWKAKQFHPSHLHFEHSFPQESESAPLKTTTPRGTFGHEIQSWRSPCC